MSYRIINGHAYAVQNIPQINDINKNNVSGCKVNKDSTKNFQSILEECKNEKFTISKHAAERLSEINFTQEDMKNIEKGFEMAKDKNSKNTVMLYKNVALIASVENNTLITAIENERAKENIYTNIDSVVIL